MKFRRALITLSLTAIFLLTFAANAFAAEEGSSDVTDRVEMLETQHNWFYWPGWAFAGLTFLVIGIVGFSWWKLVLEPKYRGRKVAQ